jgi:hypothetical protein
MNGGTWGCEMHPHPPHILVDELSLFPLGADYAPNLPLDLPLSKFQTFRQP